MLKKALITGASVGIGRSMALLLAQKGYDVAIHYRNSENEANAVCQQARKAGVNAVAVCANLCDPDATKNMIDHAYQALGGLNIVINNVGNWVSAKTSKIQLDQWHEALDSNLNSTFYVTRAALPYLVETPSSRIVNLAATGVQNIVARNDDAAYMIAKTGVVIYSKSLAKELVDRGLTVNVIAPGVAENSFDYDPSWQGELPILPTNRPAKLAEVADAAWFFIKPESQYITGQVLEVAGGWGL